VDVKPFQNSRHGTARHGWQLFLQRFVLKSVDVELAAGENPEQFEIIVTEEIEALVGTVACFQGLSDFIKVIDYCALVVERGDEFKITAVRVLEDRRKVRQAVNVAYSVSSSGLRCYNNFL